MKKAVIKAVLLLTIGFGLLFSIKYLTPKEGELTQTQEDTSPNNSAKKKIIVGTMHKDGFLEGDIIFHTSKSSQSKAIQLATSSKYSHVGILFFINNAWTVLEAVQPVKLTPLNEWIQRGVNQEFVVKRLKERNNLLTNHLLDSELI